MAFGDITFLSRNNGTGTGGSQKFAVAASSTLINSGEPVSKDLAATVVAPLATNKPVVATDFIAGIASSLSTNTASAAGSVQVTPVTTNDILLIAPKVAATWDTQAEYDALVGSRVLLDLTAGVYTILASDGATYGCVIQPLDISLHPGKVAFKFRAGCSYLA